MRYESRMQDFNCLSELSLRVTTYKLDSMARGCGQRPGAGLLAGVFIRPVGTADCA